MLISEITQPQGIYYHVTPHTRTKSILAKGLVTGKRRQWKNQFSQMLGNRSVVYVFSDYTMAVHWAAKMRYHTGTDIDIIRVRLDPNTLQPDDHPESGMYPDTWWISPPIEPSSVVDVIPVTQEMVKEFVRTRHMEPPPVVDK